MNTHTTRSYVRKLSTSTLLALLSLSAILAIIPIAPVIGATGHTILGTVNSPTAPTAFDPSTVNVTVPAGHDAVTAVDGTGVSPTSNFLAIDFSDVNFQGGQFSLSLSEGGSASPQTGDMLYSPTFAVSSFCANAKGVMSSVTNANGTFYIGWIGTATSCATNPFPTGVIPLVVGPVPILISSAYTYIKMNDSDLTPTSAEAVSTQQLVITPGITVSPSQGPALTPVVIRGGGFSAGEVVNINYSYPLYAFATDALTTVVGTLLSGVSTGPGWFTTGTTAMVDTGQAYNPAESSDYPSTPITLFAVNSSHISTALTATTAPNDAVFTEWNRYFHQVDSFTQSYITEAYASGISTFGNDSSTGASPVLPDQPITTYVFSPVIIAGGNFSVSSALTFWLGKTELSVIAGSSSTSASGSFNSTVEIPVVASGVYPIIVHDDGVNYTFNVDVNPTMDLISNNTNTNTGTASNPNTLVWVELYGFPASSTFYIYWNETSISSPTEYNVVNVTTTANGETNTSLPYSFVVPESYGGIHLVSAFSVFWGATFPNSDYSSRTSSLKSTADFGVLPSLVVTPSSFNSTYAEPGNSTTGLVSAYAEGLLPNTFYSVNIDNQMADFAVVGQNSSSAGVVVCTPHHFFFGETCVTEAKYTLTWTEGAAESGSNGVLNLTFVGAGFSPGVHVVSLTSDEEAASQGNYAPYIYALFNVTPQGSWEYVWLNSINNSISGFTGSINTLSNNIQGWINSAVTNINSNTNGQISTLTSTVTSDLSTVESDISTLSSSVSTIQSDVSTIASSVSTIQSDVSTIMSNVSTIQTDVSSVMSTVGGIQTTVGGLSGVSSQATNIMNAVNTEQTYVLVVAVLAAIILVLVLAVLIRKLS